MSKYRAFISYSQKDKKWARRIQSALERYRVPPEITVEGLSDNRQLGRFFRDDDELAGSSSLGKALEGALEESENLIVIASPNAAASQWVNEEVVRFKLTHGADQVFAVLIDGHPNASGPGASQKECFPLALRRTVAQDGTITEIQEEPLAPDVRKDGIARVKVRLAAGLLGINFDSLWRRERRRIRQLRILTTVAAMMIIAAISAGGMSLLKAQQQTLADESWLLAAEAQDAMDVGEIDQALSLVLAALPTNLEQPDRPVVDAALGALSRLMADNPIGEIVASFTEPVTALRAAYEQGVTVALYDNHKALVRLSGPNTPVELPGWMTLTSISGIAAGFISKDSEDAEGNWHFVQYGQATDLTDGKILAGFEYADLKSEWFLSAKERSPSGRRVLAKGIGEKEGRIAVLEMPNVGEHTSMTPLAEIDGNRLDLQSAKVGFANEDTVLLWLNENDGGLLSWTVGMPNVKFLLEPDAPMLGPAGLDACSKLIPPMPDDKRRDQAQLSPDRTLVALARPAGDDTWCIALWRSKTGQRLSPIVLTGAGNGYFMPLSEDQVLYVPGRSNRSMIFPKVVDRSGEEWWLTACFNPSPDSILSLIPRPDQIVFDPSVAFAACAMGDDIYLHSRKSKRAQRLQGHRGDVKALMFATSDTSAAADLLIWSGDELGTVRRWTIGQERTLRPGVSRTPIVTRGQNSIAQASALEIGQIALSHWAPNGTEQSEQQAYNPLPEPIAEAEIGSGTVDRHIELTLAGNERNLIVIEGFRCHLRLSGSPDTPCDRTAPRLTLLSFDTGNEITRIEGLARANADTPAQVAFTPAKDTALVGKRDGTLWRLDLEGGRQEAAPPLPEGEYLIGLAYAHGFWWLMTGDSPDNSDNRIIRVYFDDGEDRWVQVHQQSGQHGSLWPSSNGIRLLGIVDGVSKITYSSLQIADEMPEIKWTVNHAGPVISRSPEMVTFPDKTDTAIVIFGNSPPVIVDLENGHLSSVPELAFLRPNGITGDLVMDDAQNLAAWINHEHSILMTLPDGQQICPNFVLGDLEEAVISPMGTQIALRQAGDTIRLLNIADCIVTRQFLDPEGAMFFADDMHLWITGRDGTQRVIAPIDPVKQLQAAQRMAENND